MNKIYDVDETFETAREFFEFLLDDNIFEPKGIFDVADKFTNHFIFRGQAKKNWLLMPSAHRESNQLENYTPQPPPEDLKSDIDKYLTRQNHAEIRAVALFLEAADHVGLNTPLDYTMFEGVANSSDKLFKSELLPSIGLAQHHGVPTRLLDWTESPFIASYFAAKSAWSRASLPQEENPLFSIICLSTHLIRHLPSVDLISAPKAQNRFLRAQRGVFTIINSANNYFKTNGSWPSLEDILILERQKDRVYSRHGIIRLSLPISEAKPLLKLLYKLDISDLTIMPSLDNAAKTFNYKKSIWAKG